METTNKNYDLENYEDILRFVKERYDYKYTDDEQKIIAIMIYMLYNEVRDSNYSYDGIEEYDGLDFKIEEEETLEHYVVTINDDEEYRLFLSEDARDRYARFIAIDFVEETLNGVYKTYPNLMGYVDEDQMIEDALLDTPNLIATYDGNEYEDVVDGYDVYPYRLN